MPTDSDFDVPSTAAPKPAPSEPDTNPRGRSKSATPANAKEIAKATTQRQAGYSTEPAPVATTASEPAQLDQLPADLRGTILEAARAEADELLKAFARYNDRHASMAPFFDCAAAERERDALFSSENLESLTPETVGPLMERWSYFALVATNPPGFENARRMFVAWTLREFEPVIDAARKFGRRIVQEVEAVQAKAVEIEGNFFVRLLGRKPGKSPTSEMIGEHCGCLKRAVKNWEELLDRYAKNPLPAGMNHNSVPSELLSLAEEATKNLPKA